PRQYPNHAGLRTHLQVSDVDSLHLESRPLVPPGRPASSSRSPLPFSNVFPFRLRRNLPAVSSMASIPHGSLFRLFGSGSQLGLRFVRQNLGHRRQREALGDERFRQIARAILALTQTKQRGAVNQRALLDVPPLTQTERRQ